MKQDNFTHALLRIFLVLLFADEPTAVCNVSKNNDKTSSSDRQKKAVLYFCDEDLFLIKMKQDNFTHALLRIFLVLLFADEPTAVCNDFPPRVSQRLMFDNQYDIDTKLGEMVELYLPTSRENTITTLTDPTGNEMRLHFLNKTEVKLVANSNGTALKLVIYPVTRKHNGIWVYSSKSCGSNVEYYQVYSITIEESVDTSPSQVTHLRRGSDFYFSLKDAVFHLESCEMTKPKTAIDRYYEKDFSKLLKCGYIVPNVTKTDEGDWEIIAVGDIVFKGRVKLNIS